MRIHLYSVFALAALFCATLVLTVFPAFVSTARTSMYYVDAVDGNDGSSGTSPEDAWQTIAKVNELSFAPGDTVLFHRGQMWREILHISSTGAPQLPITFGAYGIGDLPVINGADTISGWEQETNGVWRAAVSTDPEVVYYTELDSSLSLGLEKPEMGDLIAEYDWFWSDTDHLLYVRAPGDPDIVYQSVNVGKRDYCISGATPVGHIILADLELRGANADWGGAVDFRWDGGPVTVQDCVITLNGTIGVVILNDETLIIGNTITQNVWGGIWIDSTASNWTVSRNEIAWNYSGLSFAGSGNLAEYNHIHHNTMNGIYLQYSQGNTIRFNNVHDNGLCAYDELLDWTQKFELYSSGADYNLICYNLFHHGSSNGGAGTYFDNGSVGNMIYNNVIYHFPEGPAGDPHGIGIVFENGFFITENNVVKNNICSDCRCSVAFADDIGPDNLQGNVFDNNCYFLGDIGVTVAYAGVFRTLAEWQTMQGNPDPNSIDLDPRFVDPGSEYRLLSTSPCIEAGAEVGLIIDYKGRTIPQGPLPDMGAFEFTTVMAGLTCVPAAGTLPLTTVISVSATSEYSAWIRRFAMVLDVILGGGGHLANWKAGWSNVPAGATFNVSWEQHLPALGQLVGDNVFTLTAVDVTPSPFNQPPFRVSGDTDRASYVVTGVAP